MSVRLRVALVFAFAMAIALTAGSWLLVSQVRAVTLASVDTGLTSNLSRAGQLLTAGPSGSGRSELSYGDYVYQLIDGTGAVRAASGEAGRSPLLTPAQLEAARAGGVTVTRTIDGESERVAGAPFRSRPGWVAVAATSLEGANSTVTALIVRLAIGGSVLLLLASGGAYLIARAALAPVDRLRRQAAELSARDTSAQLTVPRTRDELAALAGTMNDLLGRLQAALARQRAFVADASHELRSPLAVLCGELELATRPGRSREELAEAVGRAAEEAAWLSRLTDEMLLLARSDESTLTIRAAPAELAALLSESATAAARRAAAGQVRIEVLAPQGLTVLADRDRIRQAVDNLLDNALRFAPPGTAVTLTAGPSGPGVSIAVADSGPGFPPDFLPHAFERFRRPDADRSRAEGGAGLGLSIVEAIARAHGGSALARNRSGGGAEVILLLPGEQGPRSPAEGT